MALPKLGLVKPVHAPIEYTVNKFLDVSKWTMIDGDVVASASISQIMLSSNSVMLSHFNQIHK